AARDIGMSGASPDEKQTLATIKSRPGYWQVVVRPATFEPQRVGKKLSLLDEIIRRSSVAIRGWDFPHVSDREPLDRGLDWIGQHIVWGYHLALWRLYLSGQFMTVRGLWEDWQDVSHWGREPPEDWAPGRE